MTSLLETSRHQAEILRSEVDKNQKQLQEMKRAVVEKKIETAKITEISKKLEEKLGKKFRFTFIFWIYTKVAFLCKY